MISLNRILQHTTRFRGELKGGIIFSTMFFLFFGLFYPEEQSMADLIRVMAEMGMSIGGIDINTEAWGAWATFMVGLMVYGLVAFVSISIGSKVIPTKETEGAEFFMGSNPMNPRLFYLENMIAGLITVFAIMIPAYIIIFLQTLYFDGMDVFKGITLAFLTFMFISFFFMAITSAATTLMFQSGKAKAVGFGYMVFGFLMEIFGDSDDLKEFANASVNYYTKVASLITNTEYEWSPILVIVSISLVATVVGILRVKSPQYLENAKSGNGFSIVDATIGRVVHPNSLLGRKFPLIAEQLRRDKTAIFVVAMLYMLWIPMFWSTLSTAGNQLGTLMAGFNTPTTQALAQGRELDLTLTGFSVMKFFSNHWMFFGLYGMFVAASIPTREVRTNSQDIIYGTNVKPSKLMDHRVIAMVIQMLFVFGIGAAVAIGMNQSLGEEFINDFVGADILFSYFLIASLHYISLFVFLTGVAMIPRNVGNGRRLSIGVFIATVLINVVAYLNESIEFIKYASILNYFKPIDILYGDMSLGEGLVSTGITMVFCVTFYYLAKKFRYTDSSLY